MADNQERVNETGSNASAGNADNSDGSDSGETNQPLNLAVVQTLTKQLIQALGGANPAAGGQSSSSTNTHTSESLFTRMTIQVIIWCIRPSSAHRVSVISKVMSATCLALHA